jgi:hypothetical protein
MGTSEEFSWMDRQSLVSIIAPLQGEDAVILPASRRD